MQREILFKGKRLDNGEWVEGDFILGVGSKHGHTFILPRTHIMPSGCHVLDGWDVDPKTVGQYTGLKEDGVAKIFEGDIVRCNYFKMALGENLGATEVEAQLTGVISFNGLSLVVSKISCEQWQEYTGYEAGEGECEFYNLHNVYEESQSAEMGIEIIGNIHDNPELLKS